MNGQTVLLTGANGLIGKEAILPLQESGFIVQAVSSRTKPKTAGARWHLANLLDPEETESLFARLQPSHLLHFAWYTGPGYLDASVNADWEKAGLRILESFLRHGGKRAIFAGTCFEDDLPGIAESAYRISKRNLRESGLRFASANGLSFGWGKIYYVIGHNEHPQRLMPSLMNALRQGTPYTVNAGNLVRDYMYSKDIAAAFAAFLTSDAIGVVDICSGSGISIEEIARMVARRLGREDLLTIETAYDTQGAAIVGNSTRLCHDVGYVSQHTLESAINTIVTENDV